MLSTREYFPPHSHFLRTFNVRRTPTEGAIYTPMYRCQPAIRPECRPGLVQHVGLSFDGRSRFLGSWKDS